MQVVSFYGHFLPFLKEPPVQPDDPVLGPPFGRTASSEPAKLPTGPCLSIRTLPSERGEKSRRTATNAAMHITWASCAPFLVLDPIPDCLSLWRLLVLERDRGRCKRNKLDSDLRVVEACRLGV